MRSYLDFALGLASLLLAGAIARMATVPRSIAYLMAFSGLAYLGQGWVVGSEGFSGVHTNLILLAWVRPCVADLAGRRRLAVPAATETPHGLGSAGVSDVGGSGFPREAKRSGTRV